MRMREHMKVRAKERARVMVNRTKGCAKFPDKYAYRDKAVAQLAASHQSKELGHKVYLYKCEACKRFHLSKVRAR